MAQLMTWGEFKQRVEEQGIDDTWYVNWIDTHMPGYDAFCTAEVTKDEEAHEFTVS